MTDDKSPQTEQSPMKEKLIRLVTVFAYVSSVSMAAMCLSSYYVFFWEPKPPGPGPPVIKPHAYMAEPYPPLKLVAPLPDSDDSQGASFWQSVWSYFQPDETTTVSPVTYTTKKTQSVIPEEYITISTFTAIAEMHNTTDEVAETDGPTSQVLAILEGHSNQMDSESDSFDKSPNRNTEENIHPGYVGVTRNRTRRDMSFGSPTSGENKKGTELHTNITYPVYTTSDSKTDTNLSSATEIIEDTTNIEDTKKNQGNTNVTGSTDNSKNRKVTEDLTAKSTDHAVNVIKNLKSTDAKTNTLDKKQTKAITAPEDGTNKSEVAGTMKVEVTLKDAQSMDEINKVAKRNTHQNNSVPQKIELIMHQLFTQDATAGSSITSETKSTTVGISERASVSNFLSTTLAENEVTRNFKPMSSTTYGTSSKAGHTPGGATKVTEQTKVTELLPTKEQHTWFNEPRDEATSNAEVSSITSDSATSQTLEARSTTMDSHYQHEMRQLRPRRKFPGH